MTWAWQAWCWAAGVSPPPQHCQTLWLSPTSGSLLTPPPLFRAPAPCPASPGPSRPEATPGPHPSLFSASAQLGELLDSLLTPLALKATRPDWASLPHVPTVCPQSLLSRLERMQGPASWPPPPVPSQRSEPNPTQPEGLRLCGSSGPALPDGLASLPIPS